MRTYTEENYSKNVEEEIITENGRTKKIIKTTIKHPDGRIEESIDEHYVNDDSGFKDCGYRGP